MKSGDPEIFATVQGEGTSAGVPSVFVRLAECNLRCDWCFVPDTPILMHDWSWKRLGDLTVGERVLGIEVPTAHDERRHLRLMEGVVLRTSKSRAVTVSVNDEVRCTPDHQFWLTGRDMNGTAGAARSGWREITRAVGLRALFTAAPPNRVMGDPAFERGWLAGIADGDGCFWTLRVRRGYRRFRLALRDECLLRRAETFAKRAGFTLRRGAHYSVGFTGAKSMNALWLTVDAKAREFEDWLAEDVSTPAWAAGYLGGILDAEGSFSTRQLRIGQDRVVNPITVDRIARVLDSLNVRYTASPRDFYLRRSGGEAWRVLSTAQPAKPSLLKGALGGHPRAARVIRSVESSGRVEDVITLTTSLGSFVAAGYVVKNCDTKYTWDWASYDRAAETIELSLDDIVARTLAIAGDHVRSVVFTGGEPLLQQDELADVARRLHEEHGFRIEVETNATIAPTEAMAKHVDQWNVSPKLASSGNTDRARHRPAVLEWFAARPNAFFKLVMLSEADIAEVTELVSALGIGKERVILSPEGIDATTLAERSRWLADKCTAHGYRLGTRLHVFLWGSERGR